MTQTFFSGEEQLVELGSEKIRQRTVLVMMMDESSEDVVEGVYMYCQRGSRKFAKLRTYRTGRLISWLRVLGSSSFGQGLLKLG